MLRSLWGGVMKSIRSSEEQYGSVAVLFHWMSVLFIFAMMFLGFVMQDISDPSFRFFLYRAHVSVGVVVLFLTLLRMIWRFFDRNPAPIPGVSGLHLRGLQVIHIFLYAVLLGLVVSGLVLGIQSGLMRVLWEGERSFPAFETFRVREGHAALARVYIGLLIAHIGGVIVHQFRHGHTLSRVGIGRSTKTSFPNQ